MLKWLLLLAKVVEKVLKQIINAHVLDKRLFCEFGGPFGFCGGSGCG